MVRVFRMWASLLGVAVGVAPPMAIPPPGRHAAPPLRAVVSGMPAASVGTGEAGASLASKAQLAPRLRGGRDVAPSQLKSAEGQLVDSLKSPSPIGVATPTAQFDNQQDSQPSRDPTAFEWANSTMMLGLVLLTAVVTGVRWLVWRVSQPLDNKDPATELAAASSSGLEPPKFGVAALASEAPFDPSGASGAEVTAEVEVMHGRQALLEAALDGTGRRGLFQAITGLGLAAAAPAPALAEDQYITATFHVDLEGDDNGAGQIKVRLRPDWAPRGVRRFQELSRIGDLEDAAVFHVDSKAAHFGLPASPSLEPDKIRDDLVRTKNNRGTLTFRQIGQHSRINEMFFNKEDNHFLDRQGYAPIGEVVEGMDIVDRLYSGYGKRPHKFDIKETGNKYLDDEFPKLSKIKKVELVEA